MVTAKSRMTWLLACFLVLALLVTCAPNEPLLPMDTPLPTSARTRLAATPQSVNIPAESPKSLLEPAATSQPTVTPEPAATSPPTSAPASTNTEVPPASMPGRAEVSLVNLDVPPDDVVMQLRYAMLPGAPTPVFTNGPGVTPRPTSLSRPTSTPVTMSIGTTDGTVLLMGFAPARKLRILVYTLGGAFVTEWIATTDTAGELELRVSGGEPSDFLFYAVDEASGDLLFDPRLYGGGPFEY